MCGIAGQWFRSEEQGNEQRTSNAILAMKRRGPDASGTVRVQTASGTLVFGHARLSIIDLSSDGTQPMWSSDGQLLVVFNGEIYNYLELRSELRYAGYSFKTRTDTEVLLVAWQHWGVSCLKRFIGMFAFAIYDKRNQKITCARDAFGIKPFLYSTGNGFSFASDMLGMRELLHQPLNVNWQRAYDYLVHGDYDSTEDSFCAGVKHLLPAHVFEFDLRTGKLNQPTRWWQPEIAQSCNLTFGEAAAELRVRFLESVRLHMRSDVSLGAALSGGIDSSSIVCAMRLANPDAPLETFSYIPDDPSLSEEKWIDCVNKHVGANAHKVRCGSSDLLSDLDDLVLTQGEPFGGTSIYAQYRVFKAAREAGITVTLDGQGADEMVGGYFGYPGPRFRSIAESSGTSEAFTFLRRWAQWPDRKLTTGLMHAAAEYADGATYEFLRFLYGRSHSPAWLNLAFANDSKLQLRQPRYWRENTASRRGRRVVAALSGSISTQGLPGLLRHADRNSMRFSVESRVPFLTLDICDFAYSLPEAYLVSADGETKSVLRAAMKGIVPDALLERKDKVGFSTPQNTWLLEKDVIGDLRELMEGSEFFNMPEVDRLFTHVRRGGKVSTEWIWRMINFLKWLRLVVRNHGS